jgi:hypothetical protein
MSIETNDTYPRRITSFQILLIKFIFAAANRNYGLSTSIRVQCMQQKTKGWAEDSIFEYFKKTALPTRLPLKKIAKAHC